MHDRAGRIKAIPTRYAGVQFRSRLEAKWAASFDLCGWKWEYEPVDLDGWIPDFVILGIKPIFVEVKPIFEFDEALAADTEKKARLCDGIDEYGLILDDLQEALICGAALPSYRHLHNTYGAGDDEHLAVGWLWEGSWEVAPVFEFEPGRWDFCHAQNSFKGRYHGFYDGGHILGSDGVKALWREAGNEVQWHAAR